MIESLERLNTLECDVVNAINHKLGYYGIIVGTNGSGKTLYLKHLYSFLKTKSDKVGTLNIGSYVSTLEPHIKCPIEREEWFGEKTKEFIKEKTDELDVILMDNAGDFLSLSLQEVAFNYLRQLALTKIIVFTTHHPWALTDMKSNIGPNGEVLQKVNAISINNIAEFYLPEGL